MDLATASLASLAKVSVAFSQSISSNKIFRIWISNHSVSSFPSVGPTYANALAIFTFVNARAHPLASLAFAYFSITLQTCKHRSFLESLANSGFGSLRVPGAADCQNGGLDSQGVSETFDSARTPDEKKLQGRTRLCDFASTKLARRANIALAFSLSRFCPA